MRGPLKIKPRSREHDELVLTMVKWRAAGHSQTQIAKTLKLQYSAVNMATSRVLKDDLEHDDPNETREGVQRAYW